MSDIDSEDEESDVDIMGGDIGGGGMLCWNWIYRTCVYLFMALN